MLIFFFKSQSLSVAKLVKQKKPLVADKDDFECLDK